MDNLTNQENINRLFNQLVNNEGRNTFFIITNSVKQSWVVPKKNIKMGLNLFQPSTNQGKLVKWLFPYLYYFKLIRVKLGIATIKISIKEELNDLFQNIFQCDHLDFAFFLGSPVVHQKITIQISHKRRFLGYCKVTDQLPIKSIFEKEHTVLDDLHQLGFDDIPKCLYCAPLKKDIFTFVQNTEKTSKSAMSYKHEKLVWNFLEILHIKTALKVSFESTDYFKMLIDLKSQIEFYQLKDSEIILSTINDVESYFYERKTVFSAYHGDFTSWNCFVENNKLFAFDLEYFQRIYPPYMDYFHYYTQTAFYDKKWQAFQIYQGYIQQIENIKKYISDPTLYYKAYILNIICFYLKRENGKLNSILAASYKIWIELLYLLNKNETIQ